MAVAHKLDAFSCDASEEQKMLEAAPAPYVPTKQALEEADRVLGIKKSDKRAVRRDILQKLAKPFYNESGALLGCR